MSEKRVTKEIAVQLTEVERRKAGEEIASLVLLSQQIDDERRAAAKASGEKLKEISTRIRKRARAIRDGSELRMVDCIEREVFETNTVDTIRVDTGETVESRAMSTEERQESLAFPAPNGDDEPADFDDDALPH